MQNAPPPTSSSQIVTIDALRALFDKWRLLAPPSLLQNNKAPQTSRPSSTPQHSAPPTPIATQDRSNNPFHALEQDNSEQDAPSVPPWSPPLLPASVPRTPAPASRASRFQEATPTWLVFEDTHSSNTHTPAPQRSPLLPLPRVSTPPSAVPQRIPVAHRTRARLAPPQLSSLVELVEYHVPTQGIGTGNKAGGKRVAGTNTFHLITFADIPHHKRKEIIYTKVVCEICEGKDDENRTTITVGGNLICYPGDAGTNTTSLELIKLMLKSVISIVGYPFNTSRHLPRSPPFSTHRHKECPTSVPLLIQPQLGTLFLL